MIRKMARIRTVCALLLLLSISAVSTVQVCKSSSTPQLEKITFIHYAPRPQQASVDETVTDYRLIAGGIRWFSAISYEVNPTGSGLDPDVVMSTLGASSETWDAKTGFDLYSAPTITSDSVVSGDSKNTIGWGSLDPGIIAVTTLGYNPATKQIVEFDIIFNNAYYGWSTTIEPDKMDLQNIATHELGHNGLADLKPPKDAELTMYAFSSLGEIIKRTLGLGDILGIETLYGA